MKTTIHTLLATIALSLTAFASPALLIESTVNEHQAAVGQGALKVPSITVQSGQQAIIQADTIELGITPTLLDNGTVEINTTITQKGDKQADKPFTIITAKLGNVIDLRIRQLAFTIKVSMAK